MGRITGKITLLDVDDADAIIVQLKRGDENFVAVIDGGRKSNYKTKLKPTLVKILKDTNKLAPDLVVATHYDADHIAGLIPLVEDYKENLKEVWVHIVPEIEDDINLMSTSTNDLTELSDYVRFQERLLQSQNKFSAAAINERSNYVLASIKQLKTFLDIIPKNKLRQVYHGDSYPNWPEVKVLGPTEEFFNEVFPPGKRLGSFIEEELIGYVGRTELFEKLSTLKTKDFKTNPCNHLKTDSETRLTPTNKASIICAIDNGDKRYLFTGDAGLSSFKSIPNWKEELEYLYWLKVPHHGSDNNMSAEMINVMQPNYADSTGNHHEDLAVINCMSRNPRALREVRTTRELGDLRFIID